MNAIEYPEGVVVIEDFLDEDVCEKMIAYGEGIGFDEAAVNTRDGQQIFKEIRNNDRVFFDDENLAKDLFEKIKTFVPARAGDWQLYSLNERFRFYRYEDQQYFKWHRDGSYCRSDVEESKLTFMVYLNEGYEGGNTQFRGFEVIPQAGSALIFPHPLMHQGAVITQGKKYVLRTDVMYRKLGI